MALFNQINEFNKQPSNPALANSAPFEKAYLYVDEATAKDRAKFIGYLIEKKFITPPNKVIDLAFGSGSLTSHIIKFVVNRQHSSSYLSARQQSKVICYFFELLIY